MSTVVIKTRLGVSEPGGGVWHLEGGALRAGGGVWQAMLVKGRGTCQASWYISGLY